MGSFSPSLNLQKEYVATATGLAPRDLPGPAVLSGDFPGDRLVVQEVSARAAAGTEFRMNFRRLTAAIGVSFAVLSFGSGAGAYVRGNLHKAREGVIEESLVTFAEVRLLGDIALVLHAASTAKGKVAAEQALVAEILFGSGKVAFFFGGCKLFNGGLAEVAQSPFGRDEEITWEAIAGVLDDDVLAALSVEGTDCVSAGKAERENGVEVTNAQFLRAVFVPAVEYPACELAVLMGGD
jgi:hypothetical protein